MGAPAINWLRVRVDVEDGTPLLRLAGAGSRMGLALANPRLAAWAGRELLLGLRRGSWLGAQPFAPSYWAYTFGVAAATVSGLKLAQGGVPAAQVLALPVFVGANAFIGYLALRTAGLLVRGRLTPKG